VTTVSRLSLGVHSGTHVDAPVHFLPDGTGVDEIPFDRLICQARVVELGDGPALHAAQLEAVNPEAGERLLLKTGARAA
jgi:arylformamidase